jgi:hypothetical protein
MRRSSLESVIISGASFFPKISDLWLGELANAALTDTESQPYRACVGYNKFVTGDNSVWINGIQI